jgi:muconolactone delta-isomerase
MPKDELPSLDDFTENPVELPSVDEFITEEKVVEELPSVDEYVVDIEEALGCIPNNVLEDLPSVEEKIVDESLPTIEDYIEEEEVVEEDIETTGGISVQEYSPDMQFRDYEFIDIIKRPEWKELVGLVNEVRDNIPDIPEIKYYDDDLEKISQTIEELRSEIPVVPEVKYYDEDIDQVKQTISDLPEVKYYDQEVSNLEGRFSELKEFVSNIPNYDDELNSLRDKFNYEIQGVSETIEVKDFNKKVDLDNIKTDLKETTKNIYEELKKSSDQIHEYRLHLKDDDRKLKKQILGQYNTLKENIEKKVKEFNTKNIESQNVITGSLKEYFDELQEKINNLPEVKYYDKEIEKLNDKFEIDIQELREIVDELKETQKQDLQENLLTEPPETDNKDPLTPLDQKFVTYERLQENYQLFVNRVQQQLASFGGGGETKLQYLDDIVGVATNLSAYNGYVLKVDTSLDAPYKFKFAEESGSSNAGYANTAGISTYAVTAGIATYAETAGIATYATSSGIATYAPTAGIATDATNAGYAKTAGISTTSQGLSGTPSITVQDVIGVGATFSGNVTIGGTLTYEDVTNIDVVGLITARSGVDFGSPAVLRLEGASSTKTSSSQASVDSFTAASYRSAQYQVQITRGSIYQMTTINVLHDGTNAYLSEFGTIRTGANLATFDADINSGSLRLLATPTSSDSTVFKITKTLTVS